ncbi:hypothetical protein P9246_10790 [Aeribacillus pallidus]|uniref:hypothetical protein n=1 Tax=Aeribacillus composti TaxID=1868734 RepID=UPI002E1ED8A4|nr:hypothetical protein [Aeribacillus composti]MED4487227.1 hypothetical protein [Aeribacillus pallidus]
MSRYISMSVSPSEILESGVDVVTYILADLLTDPDFTFNVAVVVERDLDYCYIELFYDSDGFFPEKIGWVTFDFDVSDPSILANVSCNIDILSHELFDA